MSRLIYQHLIKLGMIKEKITQEGKSKDKRISQKQHIKYNLTRYKNDKIK